MEEIYLKARAKINLNLLVLGKREDGYHNLKSVFQRVNLYDEIYIRKLKTNDFLLKTNVEELNNRENIIDKAYRKLKEYCEFESGVEVIVNKKIPMQAGLAGGSTDCASFLLGMNRLFDLQLSKQEIEQIGKSLGADVVPCLYSNPVLAEGIGEKITELDVGFSYYLLIIKPKISCNTKEMFQKLDCEKEINQPDNTELIINALKKQDLEMLSKHLYNVFESLVEEKEMIQNIKQELMKNGALGSLMSGSGSCVYGLFSDKKTAQFAYQKLKEKYECYLCTSYYSKKGELR